MIGESGGGATGVRLSWQLSQGATNHLGFGPYVALQGGPRAASFTGRASTALARAKAEWIEFLRRLTQRASIFIAATVSYGAVTSLIENGKSMMQGTPWQTAGLYLVFTRT
jgi:hypothetical protein